MAGTDKPTMWREYNATSRCSYCGVSLETPGGSQQSPQTKTRDHAIPRSRRGRPHGEPNILACCAWCNQLKAARTVGQFRVFLWEVMPEWDGNFSAELRRPHGRLWFGPASDRWYMCRQIFNEIHERSRTPLLPAETPDD